MQQVPDHDCSLSPEDGCQACENWQTMAEQLDKRFGAYPLQSRSFSNYPHGFDQNKVNPIV